MTTIQAPKNGGGVSYKGEFYPADKKGIVTLPDDADLSEFASFGYTVIDSVTAAEIEAE